jgi:hypothetical protein
MVCTDAITIIVRRMPKHKSVLREQAQQINFKSVLPKQNTFKSVLNCQNTFKSVFNLLGLFVEYTFGEKLFQPIQKSFLVIGYYKKIWSHAKIYFWCALSITPPFFPNRVSSRVQRWVRAIFGLKSNPAIFHPFLFPPKRAWH